MNKKSIVERICEGEEKRKRRNCFVLSSIFNMNKEKRLINLRTFNGNLLCKYMLMYFATESVWMYYFVTLTIHSPYLTKSEFSSQKYIKHLSNMSTICQIFVKYVKHLSNMSTIECMRTLSRMECTLSASSPVFSILADQRYWI